MNLNAESVNTPGRWLTDPASTVSKKLDRWCTVPKHECCRHTQNIALQRQGSVNPIQRYMRLQHDSTCKRYQVTARHDVTGDHEIVNHNHFRLDRIQFLVENAGCDQRFLQPVCQHQRPRGHTLDWSRKMISMWTAATIRGQLRVVTLDRLLCLIIHRRSYTLMVVPGQGTLEKMDTKWLRSQDRQASTPSWNNYRPNPITTALNKIGESRNWHDWGPSTVCCSANNVVWLGSHESAGEGLHSTASVNQRRWICRDNNETGYRISCLHVAWKTKMVVSNRRQLRKTNDWFPSITISDYVLSNSFGIVSNRYHWSVSSLSWPARTIPSWTHSPLSPAYCTSNLQNEF